MFRKTGWMLTAAVLFTAGSASAQMPFGLVLSEQSRVGFTLQGAGARAAGMGNAFTALADDATAASFNPAGLAQLLVPEVSIVGRREKVSDTYNNFVSLDQNPPLDLTNSTLRSSTDSLNFISLTIPARIAGLRWAFQLSSQEAVDFTYRGSRSFEEVDAAGTPLFLLNQNVDQTGDINTWTGAVAVQLTTRTLLGLAVNRWVGDWHFHARYDEAAVDTPEDTEFFEYSQKNKLRGWNADLGLLLKYPHWNLGIRYRTSFSASYGFQGGLDTNLETKLEPASGNATLHWPSTLNVGLAFLPTDRLVLTADYGRTNWALMRFDNTAGEGELNFFDLLPADQSGARVAEDVRLGVEYLFFAGRSIIPVRAGLLREPWPVEDRVTGDRMVSKGFALGIGFKRGPWAVDLAWQHRWGNANVSRFQEPDEIARGELFPTSVGELKRTRDRIVLSVIVQFPSGSGTEKALHEIFVGPSRE